MPPRISAALIVRDEERFLPGCLESLRGRVDEVVVVDTGSTDRTDAIAREAGARLLSYRWHDDFAAARNFGLDAATGDWILYIDADERLSVPEGAGLADGLGDPGLVAARLGFRPRVRATPYRELRLFRNLPQIRFRGVIHETMLPAVEALVEAGRGAVGQSPAEIVHLGYEGDQSHKHRRNLPLLRAAVAAEPGRLYYRLHLAETLAGLGRNDEAIAAAGEGLALARPGGGGRAERAIAGLLALTLARLQREAGAEALPAIAEGLAFHPEQRALLFLKARVLADRGDNAAALAILDRLRLRDGPGFADPDVSYDLGIFGAEAHDLAGVVLLRLGRRREAAEAFARAAAEAPDNPAYRVKAAALA